MHKIGLICHLQDETSFVAIGQLLALDAYVLELSVVLQQVLEVELGLEELHVTVRPQEIVQAEVSLVMVFLAFVTVNPQNWLLKQLRLQVLIGLGRLLMQLLREECVLQQHFRYFFIGLHKAMQVLQQTETDAVSITDV